MAVRDQTSSSRVGDRVTARKGRDLFLEAVARYGVRYVFGNPGTTEMPILEGLTDHPEVEYVLALHEAVALGAAHYYTQASGIPSVVNLHVGPGLGNSLGMLYNVWEAGTPLLVTAGQQDSRLRLREPLLGHDLVAMARPLVKWSEEVRRVEELPLLVHRALKTALDPPTGPVFLSLPIDVLEQETEAQPLGPGHLFRRAAPEPEAVEQGAELLLGAHSPAIVIGDGVAQSGAQRELLSLAELLGAPVFYEGLYHRLSFPTSHPSWQDRMAADAEGIRRTLAPYDTLLLVGGSFFEEVWHSDGPYFPSGSRVLQIEAAEEKLARNFAVEVGIVADPRTTLAALQEAVATAADETFRLAAEERNATLAEQHTALRLRQKARAKERWDDAPISPARLMAELEATLPDDAVVVNESITAGADLRRSLAFEEESAYYGTRGGGIGQGLPGGLGVQLAHPDRPVVVLSGDGSAMYSIQALWTAAHHRLPVVFVILHNRSYRILKFNMDVYRRRFELPADRPYPHMDLTSPELGFADLARGMGVEAISVDEPDEIRPALERALASDRPHLLDVWVEGRIHRS